MGHSRYKDAVERGVAYLDETIPNWRKTIDPDDLNLKECDHCILGQLFADYEKGRTFLGLTDVEARRLGFNVPYDFGRQRTPSELRSAFRSLTGWWKTFIYRGLDN